MTVAPRTGRRWQRWPVISLLLATLLAISAWWINRQLEPQRFATLVLNQAGQALNLKLAITGIPDYALRPEPRIRLPGFSARLVNNGPVLMRAHTLEVSLPWSTLLERDAGLVITRIGLDAPELDLAVLRQWLAMQPATPFELPAFNRGLHITEGTLRDVDWSLQNWSLELASLQPKQAATVITRGTLRANEQRIDFDGEVSVSSVSANSDLSFALQGQWQKAERTLPYRLAAQGHFRAEGSSRALTMNQIALDSESPLPDFTGHLEAMTTATNTSSATPSNTLQLSLRGELAAWPNDWPALPVPVSQSSSPVQISADYLGANDFSGTTQLTLHRDQTSASASLQWPRLQAWLNDPAAEPLPPIDFSVSSPRIELDGTIMEGVTVELQEPGNATQ